MQTYCIHVPNQSRWSSPCLSRSATACRHCYSRCWQPVHFPISCSPCMKKTWAMCRMPIQCTDWFFQDFFALCSCFRRSPFWCIKTVFFERQKPQQGVKNYIEHVWALFVYLLYSRWHSSHVSSVPVGTLRMSLLFPFRLPSFLSVKHKGAKHKATLISVCELAHTVRVFSCQILKTWSRFYRNLGWEREKICVIFPHNRLDSIRDGTARSYNADALRCVGIPCTSDAFTIPSFEILTVTSWAKRCCTLTWSVTFHIFWFDLF